MSSDHATPQQASEVPVAPPRPPPLAAVPTSAKLPMPIPPKLVLPTMLIGPKQVAQKTVPQDNLPLPTGSMKTGGSSSSRGRSGTAARNEGRANGRGGSSTSARERGGSKGGAGSGGASGAKGTANVDPDLLAAERRAFEDKLSALTAKYERIVNELEDDIGDMEEEYIVKTWAHGNVLRGWDGTARKGQDRRGESAGNGSGTGTGAPKYRKRRPNDRIFSLSSSTSKFRKENPDVQIMSKAGDKKKKKKR